MYNTADARARAARPRRRRSATRSVPLYVLNVTYPLIDAELTALLRRQARVLSSRKASPTSSSRASPRSCAGPTSRPAIARQGHAADGRRVHRRRGARRRPARSSRRYRPDLVESAAAAENALDKARLAKAAGAVAPHVHARPPSFCTGCPERPIFAAMKLVERELGPASRQRRHRLPPVLDPAAVQHRQHDDGLRPRRRRRRGAQRQGRQARDRGDGRRRLLAQRPDQRRSATPCSTRATTSSSSSTTATRPRPAARTSSPRRPHNAIRSDRQLDREGGARRRRRAGCARMRHTYDVAEMRDTLQEALTTTEKGPKVIVAQSRMHAEPAAPRCGR